MMKRSSANLMRELARVGAQLRRVQLVAELAELDTFLDGAPVVSAPPAVPDAKPARKAAKKSSHRKPRSAAERKAISTRMRKHWDAVRAGKIAHGKFRVQKGRQ